MSAGVGPRGRRNSPASQTTDSDERAQNSVGQAFSHSIEGHKPSMFSPSRTAHRQGDGRSKRPISCPLVGNRVPFISFGEP